MLSFGFEGGTCRKVNGVNYLFTTELFDDKIEPLWHDGFVNVGFVKVKLNAD